jgi:hypothetical protein
MHAWSVMYVDDERQWTICFTFTYCIWFARCIRVYEEGSHVLAHSCQRAHLLLEGNLLSKKTRNEENPPKIMDNQPLQ